MCLSSPKPLELTAVSENVIMDHLKVFEMNGFKFDINPEGNLPASMEYMYVRMYIHVCMCMFVQLLP